MTHIVLCHHGIKGQKWGVRRFQNTDGTYTPLGKKMLTNYKKKVGNKLTSDYEKRDRSGMSPDDIAEEAVYFLMESHAISTMTFSQMNKEKIKSGKRIVETMLQSGSAIRDSLLDDHSLSNIKRVPSRIYGSYKEGKRSGELSKHFQRLSRVKIEDVLDKYFIPIPNNDNVNAYELL